MAQYAVNAHSLTTKFLQFVHMEIEYGDWIKLMLNQYIRTLIECSRGNVLTYDMHALSGSDTIQALQQFCLDVGQLPSRFYT